MSAALSLIPEALSTLSCALDSVSHLLLALRLPKLAMIRTAPANHSMHVRIGVCGRINRHSMHVRIGVRDRVSAPARQHTSRRPLLPCAQACVLRWSMQVAVLHTGGAVECVCKRGRARYMHAAHVNARR
jgi:hypothetical protein